MADGRRHKRNSPNCVGKAFTSHSTYSTHATYTHASLMINSSLIFLPSHPSDWVGACREQAPSLFVRHEAPIAIICFAVFLLIVLHMDVHCHIEVRRHSNLLHCMRLCSALVSKYDDDQEHENAPCIESFFPCCSSQSHLASYGTVAANDLSSI